MKSGSGLVLFGTRPEAIKILTVVQALRRREGMGAVHVCCSGQHKDLVEETRQSIKLDIDVNFQLMEAGQTPADITQKVLARTIQEITNINPSWILVHGDTATTLGGALAGFYAQVPVIHLEAGLRTYNKNSPWPEEGIRQAVSRLADYHLASTPRARQNLLNEKIPSKKIIIVGNPGADLLLGDMGLEGQQLGGLIKKENHVLVTLHRRENQGKYLSEVLKGLVELASEISDVNILFVMHPNPKIHSQIDEYLRNLTSTGKSRIKFLKPLPYQDFQVQLKNASLIITDSGGLQEEAALLGIPTIIARETTERPEIVELGLAQMATLKDSSIASMAVDMLGTNLDQQKVAAWRQLQGSGLAGDRAASAIVEFLAQN